jgi:hypothetical protein
VGITGGDKDKLEVVGDGVDTVCLVSCLRRKLGHADILQVEEVKPDDPATNKESPDGPTPPPEPVPPPPHPDYTYTDCCCCCHHHHPPPPMVICEEPSNCAVM